MLCSLLLLTSLALSASGQFVHAPVITDNVDATYTATLDNNPNTTIRGTVTASAAPGGTGLAFSVHFTGLPADLGPFPYHVHINRVPADGDCYATGEHLDPYGRGETPPCDSSDPSTCQIGDLSGKHGFATSPEFTAEYTDPYLSNNPDSNAFIGDRSIVIHAANDVRLNCGNFQLVSGGATTSSHVAPTGTTTGTHGVQTNTNTHPASAETVATHPATTETTTNTHAVPPPHTNTATHSIPPGVNTTTHTIPTVLTTTHTIPTTLTTHTLPRTNTTTVH